MILPAILTGTMLATRLKAEWWTILLTDPAPSTWNANETGTRKKTASMLLIESGTSTRVVIVQNHFS